MIMKSSLVLGALTLSLALSGVALAADMPASAPPPPDADPLAAIFNPIGTAVGLVVNGVIVTPITTITTAISSPPPAPPVVARY